MMICDRYYKILFLLLLVLELLSHDSIKKDSSFKLQHAGCVLCADLLSQPGHHVTDHTNHLQSVRKQERVLPCEHTWIHI